ncbi:MAG: SpoIIE family protein phosphatase [Oligoflexia bacterium]|nr:SpoIIE family protein phosphatase [Oligoflexia bacterium]
MDKELKDKRLGFAFKLSALTILGATIVFCISFIYNYQSSKKIILELVNEKSHQIISKTIAYIENINDTVSPAPTYLAQHLEPRPLKADELLLTIKIIVATNPLIFGMTVAHEPYYLNSKTKYYAPYLYKNSKNNNKIETIYLGNDGIDFYNMDWYKPPKDQNMAIWSEPYFDEGGGKILMTTYSVPFTQKNNRLHGSQNKFTGIVTADVSLESLKKMIGEIKIYNTGYAFLLSKNGNLLTPLKGEVNNYGNIIELAKTTKDNDLIKMLENTLSKEHPSYDVKKDNIERDKNEKDSIFQITSKSKLFLKDSTAILYYLKLKYTGWILFLVIPENELFNDVNMIFSKISFMALIGIILLSLITMLVVTKFTNPLRLLTQKANEMAKGNFNEKITLELIDQKDEIGTLSSSFEHMRAAIKDYIANLEETTAAKERIESELKIATNIQLSFLPKKYPPFTSKYFNVSAILDPAKEVGGDLYDLRMVDNDHLFLQVGDVSGKGVPAALFMAVTQTLIKGLSKQYIDPAQILMDVNKELSRSNEECMFVTVLAGTLNIKTGLFTYSNAGHLAPLLIRPSANSGNTNSSNITLSWLDLPPGVVLGVNENAIFEKLETTLQHGDYIILYTDGLIEAHNKNKELYSPERFESEVIKIFEKHKSPKAEIITKHLIESVINFADGEPAFDDTTILTLQYLPNLASSSASSKKNR